MASRVFRCAGTCMGGVLRLSGLAAVVRRSQALRVPILTYHKVTEADVARGSCFEMRGMVVRAEPFRRQMEYVAKHYNVVTLGDFVSYAAGERLPPHPCVVTFDDGFADTYHTAVPILRDLGLTATFFIIGRPLLLSIPPLLHAAYDLLDSVSPEHAAAVMGDVIGCPGRHRSLAKIQLLDAFRRWFEHAEAEDRSGLMQRVLDELAQVGRDPCAQFMTPGQICKLSAQGFEIGGHSMAHVYLSRQTATELREDIGHCSKAINRLLGAPPRVFSFPYGNANSWDQRVIEVLRENGYVCSCTTESGLNDHDADPFTLRRIGVYGRTTFSAFVFGLLGLEPHLREAASFGRS